MAFIRAKRIGETTYYTLVESRREGSKVRQVSIASLGRCATVDDAIEVEQNYLADQRRYAEYGRKRESNGRWMFTHDGLFSAQCGEPAERRADKAEKKIALLLRYRDVVGKGGSP